MEAETQVVRGLPAESAPASVRIGARAGAVALLGPLTVVVGVAWAILQPYRITLLHPRRAGLLVPVRPAAALGDRGRDRSSRSSSPGRSSPTSRPRGGTPVTPPARSCTGCSRRGVPLPRAAAARRGDRRRDVWRRAARGASTSGPGSRSRSACCMWPVMTFFTNSAIHMLAHGAWAQALMVMGGSRARARAREAAQPLVEADDADRARRLRAPRSSSTSRTTGSSRARRSCTTCSAGRSCVGALFPLALVFRPRSVVAAVGLRRAGRRGRGDALLRPRRRAGLRPSLAARRGAAPMRRVARRSRWPARRARRCPPRRAAHATLRSASPGFQRARSSVAPKAVRAPLRPDRRRCRRCGCSTAAARPRRAPCARTAPTVVAPLRTLPKGAYTVRWHALSADSHVVSGVWTFGVRVHGAAADRRPTARSARRGPSTSSAGATSSRSRSSIGALGFRLLVPARAAAAAARSRSGFYLVAGIGVVGVLEVGHPRVLPALPRTCCSCRSASSSTATSRRSRPGRASARRSSR